MPYYQFRLFFGFEREKQMEEDYTRTRKLKLVLKKYIRFKPETIIKQNGKIYCRVGSISCFI